MTLSEPRIRKGMPVVLRPPVISRVMVVDDLDGDKAECAWHNDNGDPVWSWYRVSSLDPAES